MFIDIFSSDSRLIDLVRFLSVSSPTYPKLIEALLAFREILPSLELTVNPPLLTLDVIPPSRSEAFKRILLLVLFDDTISRGDFIDFIFSSFELISRLFDDMFVLFDD